MVLMAAKTSQLAEAGVAVILFIDHKALALNIRP